MLRLYSYFRSSSAYRVRIALNLKAIPYEIKPVHLLRDGGQQHRAEYAAYNPAHLVPVLEDGTVRLTQSLAIIEYLEEIHPSPALLPEDPAARAWVRAIAADIACEIQPLNNLRVMQYLKSAYGLDEPQRAQWSREWLELGFAVIEARLASNRSGSYCHGSAITLADCCLVPQVFNAQRLGFELRRFPRVMQVYESCMSLEPFQKASPGSQIDAE